MTTKHKVVDSPKGWVAQHIKEYVESDGKKGHRWRGYPTLLLTTKGRKTGILRRTALIYGRDGDDYLLVASYGGAADHPLWYLNLVADPNVELQVGAEKFKAKARPVKGAERARLWKIMTGVYPTYDDYQKKTKREIPVIVLQRQKAEPKSAARKKAAVK
jgi:deazaflavin-dependent oxidoreductase (nitroreductase family)